MKIKAEMHASTQHNETGIDSIISPEPAGSIEMGEVSLIGFGAVMSGGGGFDGFTVDRGGFGTADIAIRAVSFFGLDAGFEGGKSSAFCATGAGAEGKSGGSPIGSAIDGV